MSLLPPWAPQPPSATTDPRQVAAALRIALADDDHGAVAYELLRSGRPAATARDVGRFAGGVAERLERPLFRPALEDLAGSPAERGRSVLRLVDAARLAGAAVLLDEAAVLAASPGAAAAVRVALADWDGGVVLLDVRPGAGDVPLADRVLGRAHVPARR